MANVIVSIENGKSDYTTDDPNSQIVVINWDEINADHNLDRIDFLLSKLKCIDGAGAFSASCRSIVTALEQAREGIRGSTASEILSSHPSTH